jgi:hypothetical protein
VTPTPGAGFEALDQDVANLRIVAPCSPPSTVRGLLMSDGCMRPDIYLSLFINIPPAIDQKTPKAEASPNRVLKNDASAKV